MQTGSDNHKFKTDNPEWYLIAEYSLSDALVDEEMPAGLWAESLFQTMRALGLPQDCLKRVERMITDTVQGSADDFHLDSLNARVDIHLFCHKRTVDRMVRSEEQMNGGWGYYGIERGNASDVEHHRVIELYLYKEGE